jgi:hypothetical protein
MVAVIQATGSQGSWIGAVATVLFYGVLPVAIVAYLFFSPARRRVRRAAERAAAREPAQPAGSGSVDPDDRGHATGDAVSAVREEP